MRNTVIIAVLVGAWIAFAVWMALFAPCSLYQGTAFSEVPARCVEGVKR
jgi:hypothetical protein